MTITEWIESNVKPNVLSVGKITPYEPDGDSILYDISVVVKTGEKTANKQTQSVYEIGGEFYARSIVKNWEAPITGKTTEEDLLDEFLSIESDVGQEVKVDPEFLEGLGVKVFVYTDSVDSKKKATVRLNGIRVTREVG